MTEARPGQVRVLLVPYSYVKNPYGAQHFEALMKLGYFVDLRTQHFEPPYDVVVQMGIGEWEKRFKGLQVTAALRKEFPSTPILVVSGNDPSRVEAEVKAHGADYFFRKDKPNELNEFVACVKELIAKTKSAG